MRTNVLGAMRLMPVLAPLLAPSQGTLAFVSSKMGSIAEAQASYGMLYRSRRPRSTWSRRWPTATTARWASACCSLHPGWVRTDMGGPNADVDVADSVAGLRRVIAERAAHPGGGFFFDWRGQPIPW